MSTEYPDLVKELKNKDVDVKVSPLMSKGDKFVSFILSLLPFLISFDFCMHLGTECSFSFK